MHHKNPQSQGTPPGGQPPEPVPAAGDVIASDAPASRDDPAGAPPDADTQLQSALNESAQARDALLRALADAENMRKRSSTELVNAHKYAVEGFAANLLP